VAWPAGLSSRPLGGKRVWDEEDLAVSARGAIKLNKDPSAFMLEEYVQTNLGFFHLQDKINDWFKTFIALYGIPFTVLAAVIGLGQSTDILDLFALPGIVAFLLAVIALLGLFVAMTIVSMRMEMILYERAVNDVRRYFAEIGKRKRGSLGISDFLILPTSDLFPPFYEPWRDTFWQVLFIGFLDSLTLYVAIANLVSLDPLVLPIPAALYWALHWFGYWATARARESQWHALHPKNLQTANY
jgi:hypothetical protein